MYLSKISPADTSYNDLTGTISVQLNIFNPPSSPTEDYFKSLNIDIERYTPIAIRIYEPQGFSGGNSQSKLYIDVFAIDIELNRSYERKLTEIPVTKFEKVDTLINFISKIDGFDIVLFSEKEHKNKTFVII